jgi:hypothetical protein
LQSPDYIFYFYHSGYILASGNLVTISALNQPSYFVKEFGEVSPALPTDFLASKKT